MPKIMQLRAWLIDSEPEIWRRILVDPRLTLAQLHTVLQCSFGWTDSHLHQFHQKDGTRYAIPMDSDFDDDEACDERKFLVAELLHRPSATIAYEYDFGDSWMHAIRLEKSVDLDSVEFPPELLAGKGKRESQAAFCIAGERSGPPEDCGGIWGLQEILALKAEPPHPTAPQDADDRERLEWLGDWEPNRVDLAEIDQLLGRLRVKKSRAR